MAPREGEDAELGGSTGGFFLVLAETAGPGERWDVPPDSSGDVSVVGGGGEGVVVVAVVMNILLLLLLQMLVQLPMNSELQVNRCFFLLLMLLGLVDLVVSGDRERVTAGDEGEEEEKGEKEGVVADDARGAGAIRSHCRSSRCSPRKCLSYPVPTTRGRTGRGILMLGPRRIKVCSAREEKFWRELQSETKTLKSWLFTVTSVYARTTKYSVMFLLFVVEVSANNMPTSAI